MQHLACSPNEFGQGCIQQCQCRNGALCNAVNGSCTCTAGYTGVNCNSGKLKSSCTDNTMVMRLTELVLVRLVTQV